MRWIDNFKQAYLRSSKNLIEAGGRSADSSYEVGGSFDAIGYLEKQLLLHHGLMPNHSLVDIGCGSGRLLSQLGDDDIASLSRYGHFRRTPQSLQTIFDELRLGASTSGRL
ncbi:hypothetical protein ACMAZH_00180 [Arenicellales bacterium nBUS_45]